MCENYDCQINNKCTVGQTSPRQVARLSVVTKTILHDQLT